VKTAGCVIGKNLSLFINQWVGSKPVHCLNKVINSIFQGCSLHNHPWKRVWGEKKKSVSLLIRCTQG
jgi:hypothetical protein